MPAIREVEADVEVLPPENRRAAKPGDDPFIALMARLMDEFFVIPGTKIRFGIDPLIGLIPGIGGMASAFVSLFLIGLSSRQRVPKIVLARMALNVLLNTALEAIPVIGDAASIFFRSNARNYELLRRHAGTARPASTGDWLFVFGLLGAVGLVVVIFVVSVAVLIWRMLFG
jgi:hypothetical protein